MQIPILLGTYFDATVVIVTSHWFLFRLALTIHTVLQQIHKFYQLFWMKYKQFLSIEEHETSEQ